MLFLRESEEFGRQIPIDIEAGAVRGRGAERVRVDDAVGRPQRLQVVDEGVVRDVYAYVLLSIVVFVLLTVFVVTDAARAGVTVTEFDALGAAAATFLNIGPAFGDAGPYGTFATFPMSTRAVMIMLMWIGRIDIIPVLVLFTRAFWTS